jgi:hypothetical protein
MFHSSDQGREKKFMFAAEQKKTTPFLNQS